MIQVHLLCCSTGTLNLQQSARSRPPHTLVNPRLQILLFCWHQKPPLPTEAQHASLFLTARDTSLPCQRENVRFPTEDRKSTTSYSSGNTSSVPHGTQNSSVSHCISLKESHVSLVQVLESQLFHQVAICYSASARRPTPVVHRDPAFPTVTSGEPLNSHLRPGTSVPSQGRKEVIGSTTTKTLQGVMYQVYTSLRNTAGAPGGK
jgi:hypothetical protein